MASLSLRIWRLTARLAAPLAAVRLARAAAGQPELAARQAERHGRVGASAGRALWIHAASVGEMHAAAPLIGALSKYDPSLELVVSTITHTAAIEFDRRFGARPRIRHLFAPLDERRRVARWLDAVRPSGLILVETELWPEMLAQCRARSIPVALVNGRISTRAQHRYRRFSALCAQMLAAIDPVLAQNETHARRLRALGAKQVRVTGNLKFDAEAPAEPDAQIRAWAACWAERRSWVAGSTHAGEEELLGTAQRALLAHHRSALLLVVPRHPARAEQARAALAATGLETCLVDALPNHPGAQAVVVDRIGVLGSLYRTADACFVGGSLVEGVGGHNLIEPALAGKPVLTGPFTADQHDAAQGLEAAGGLLRTDSAPVLTRRLAEIFEQPERAAKLAERARSHAEAQRGAVQKTLSALAPWLADHQDPRS